MKPILNLNKHPKDCENLSLVDADNIVLSKDVSCLELDNVFTLNLLVANRKILYILPCNNEYIIFLYEDNVLNLYRYSESLKQRKLVYEGLDYYNGKIKGTFVYNVNNDLIITFSEYNGDIDVPLRTINLGKFEDTIEPLPKELLYINPEVYIPTLSDYNYVPGNLPKGWYSIFIRYKIDNNDYTQWFNITNSILISTLEKQSIFKLYGYIVKDNNDLNVEPFSTGVLDHFESELEYSNETLELLFKNLDDRYKYYQIGFICYNNITTKAYKTFDINTNINKYILINENIEEYDYKDLITLNYNFYNTKNIINYKNRLYISNYKEKALIDYDTSNINVLLKNKISSYSDIKTIGYSISENTKENYINIDKEVNYVNNNLFEEDSANAIIVPNLIYNNIKYNEIFESTENINLSSSSFFAINLTKDIVKKYTTYKNDTYVVDYLCTILTNKNNILKVQLYIEQPDRLITGNGYFKYTINNQSYISKINITYWDSVNLALVGQIDSYNANITSDILISNSNNNFGSEAEYINTKNSFNDRRKNSTLIPGEIYNFYIHFVDKYGYSTKGFKLKPKPISYGIPIIINYESEGIIYKYCMVKPNSYIFNEFGEIILDDDFNVILGNDFIYKKYNNELYLDDIQNGGFTIGNQAIIEQLEKLYKHLSENKNLKWEDLSISESDVYIFNTEEEYNQFVDELVLGNVNKIPEKYYFYLPYYTKNNEELFKIPFTNVKYELINNQYFYNFENINFDILNVELPEDYIGYFISYEQFEETSKFTGILSKYDFNDIEYENNNELNVFNKTVNDKMYFYCSDFDTLENIDLNCNLLRIEKQNCYKSSNNPDIINNSIIKNIANLNIPEIESENNNIRYYYIKDFNIKVGGDVIKNRFGLGTCLEIPIIKELFPDNEINIYKVSLLNISDKYVSEDKKLIKCTNIIYPNKYPYTITQLNGKHTYNNVLVYDNNKFIYNDNTLQVNAENNKKYIDYGDNETKSNDNVAKLLSYIQIPCYKNFFYETKSFKEKPQNVTFRLDLNDGEKEEINIELGCIVKPENTISLFKNNYNKIEEIIPIYYQNNRTDIKYITEFDKFVRRSDIIQDESISNAWRRFGLENYKVISENKGKITNIVGIGYYLLVHTEHSLFAFNSSNTLKTLDDNIQLKIPDIFDLDYRELITSSLGYAGLQNQDSYVLGEFGYIFYDNDAKRIFRFDNEKLDYIDLDIYKYLLEKDIKYIKFGHDKINDRIILLIQLEYNKYLLTYNYKINKFVSFLCNSTDKQFYENFENTKDTLYIYSNKSIYSITKNRFDQRNIGKVSFIINENYNHIKFLETITYKLYKQRVNSDRIDSKKPYSGETIRVYNDLIDTGELDISIDIQDALNIYNNYKKPYYNKGNWNFSYLRDKTTKSRLYGNYFIIEFTLKREIDETVVIEFESLGYFISKDKKNG